MWQILILLFEKSELSVIPLLDMEKMKILLFLIFVLYHSYGAPIKDLSEYLDLLQNSLEKDKGVVQESKWMEVGKRGEPEEELEDFLKYIKVWEENLRKENESIETYRLYKDIGKRDNQKENLKNFLNYLEDWKQTLDDKDDKKNPAKWLEVGK